MWVRRRRRKLGFVAKTIIHVQPEGKTRLYAFAYECLGKVRYQVEDSTGMHVQMTREDAIMLSLEILRREADGNA